MEALGLYMVYTEAFYIIIFVHTVELQVSSMLVTASAITVIPTPP